MSQPTFPLIVHDDERPTLRTALEVYRDDFGHEEHRIVALVDDILARLPADEHTPLELDAAAMKVTHGALHSLLEDSQRERAGGPRPRPALRDRMPGEANTRAIAPAAEPPRRG